MKTAHIFKARKNPNGDKVMLVIVEGCDLSHDSAVETFHADKNTAKAAAKAAGAKPWNY